MSENYVDSNCELILDYKENVAQQIQKLHGLNFIDDRERDELMEKCKNDEIHLAIEQMWKIVDKVNGIRS